ncbi:serine hydrolase [Micromonospora polyrhachis]|uniref:CubicO group peptidase (Beta-lactamase class C family) n=1 Tax=Micromonospora polyrhachis TaxID=1282883 RepID=A0A7W7WR10_9ACTN|nr:serine hydrolase domain-containing protein [Micromonospora polyrhachis]MBB4959853.1 CubicO group peptidase (beta-lactamase class C family) [Micromonospora polyrhachis]
MTHATSQAGLDRLREEMTARVVQGELPGMVYVVACGDAVRVEAIGEKSFGSGDPMRRDTIFRIASMTKPILAVATMMLVAEGRLALDEPVDRLLPELANRRVLRNIEGPLDDTVPAIRPITVEDLLTSRMGYGLVVEPSFDPPYPVITAAAELQLTLGPPDPRTPHDPDEWMKRFATLPLMYQPGQRWQYNVASLVLGVLVARAAGQSLADLLRTRIFEPLGMTATGFSVSVEDAGRLPGYYQTNTESGQSELQRHSAASEWTVPPVFLSGASGLVSTVDDYLAFARLLLARGTYQGRRLLSERAVELITTNHLTPEQAVGSGFLLDGNGWGYGVGVVTRPDEVSPTPGRYGWTGGYGTAWSSDPTRGLVAIVLTQHTDFLFNGGWTEFEKLVYS